MKLTFITKSILTLLLVSFSLALPSCTVENPIPTGTPTIFSTETPTSTIIWFPPTNTPTFFPAKSPLPTQDYHPGLGGISFTDSFDQLEFWNITNSGQASASLTRNRLVLSINGEGPLSIISLRNEPELKDFYAEVNVTINLCSGKDQYGMIVRATPGNNYYRFSINCTGQSRLERVRDGVSYPLSDWLSSGDVPSGAPAQVKMGIWAVGREVRAFLNDHYQFSISDPVFSSGTLGFFIFASGQTPVTVSYSDLSVYSVSYVPPTPSLPPSTLPSNPTLGQTPNP